MQRILMFDDPPAAEFAPGETEPQETGTEDFELVVGRRQAAALTFLALVVVAVCSGGSYLAGKAIAPREAAEAPLIKLEELSFPPLEATIVAPVAPLPPAGLSPSSSVPVAEAPLFASAVPRAIYIQVGAVEKGVATVLAEGLRRHELPSFVAPGPSDKTYRVLIGPFADASAYQKAQGAVDRLGLANFARRYETQ
jgi:cell division septation protein DedD